MNQFLRASYKFGPIKSFEKLAEVLGTSVHELHRLRRQADRSYRLVGTSKKDGTTRITWNPSRHLKNLQGRINSRLLRCVSFFFQAEDGIRDANSPRDYAKNASIHAGQACVINEDIAHFFPSI